MAFLVYFFVLLVMAASILFGLDWAKAPLHAPASHQSAQTASAQHPKPERAAQQKPLAAVPVGRAETKQPATSGMAIQPEAVAQEPQPARPAPERAQAAASSSPAEGDLPSSKAEAQEQPAPQKRVDTERSTVGVTAQETPSSEQRDVQERQKASKDKKAPSKAEARTRSESRRHASRRKTRDERDADVPDWAIRGAEAAQREAEFDRRGEAPRWVVRGAEAAQREYDRGGPPGPTFVPFWERNEGWHFR